MIEIELGDVVLFTFSFLNFLLGSFCFFLRGVFYPSFSPPKRKYYALVVKAIFDVLVKLDLLSKLAHLDAYHQFPTVVYQIVDINFVSFFFFKYSAGLL